VYRFLASQITCFAYLIFCCLAGSMPYYLDLCRLFIEGIDLVEKPRRRPRAMAQPSVPEAEWPAIVKHEGSFLSEHVLMPAFAEKKYNTLGDAMSAAIFLNKGEANSCGGVTRDAHGKFTLRLGTRPIKSKDGLETCWLFVFAHSKKVALDESSIMDFEQFNDVYIPGYPKGMKPKSCIFGTREEALDMCRRANPDLITGVTFNPDVGYTARGGKFLVASEANEVTWLPTDVLKRKVSTKLYTQSNKRKGNASASSSSDVILPLPKTGVWAEPKT
jgi:hypothetical protein